jgi:phosphatidylserine/phosphatidylglycerophosphate/cardiolipin synthase-like enzyme
MRYRTTHAIPLLLLAAVYTSFAQVEVYFNSSTDSSVALGTSYASGDADFLQLVTDYIGAARSSVDMAMYNLTRDAVTDALIDAHDRGVRVRVIGHVDNVVKGESFQRLRQAGVVVWHNPQADSGERQALMHDKFFVIDADAPSDEHGTPVTITGSWNATYWQTISDPNNIVVLHDSTVASLYKSEFEEMWGGQGDLPDSTRARFGANKRAGTARNVTLADGNRVTVWFSPADSTSAGIEAVLATAQSSICVAAYSFTYDNLGARLKTQHDSAGADVRVLIDNTDDIGSEFPFLQAFADVHAWDSPKLLHHKYAIVDAIPVSGGTDPVVVTGSHNWSYSAERYNDENAIAIFDDTTANHYLQEFAARYSEAGGSRPFQTGSRVTAQFLSAQSVRILPNPVGSSMEIWGWRGGTAAIHDVTGRIVRTIEVANRYPSRVDVSDLPAGAYFVELRTDTAPFVVPLRICR